MSRDDNIDPFTLRSDVEDLLTIMDFVRSSETLDYTLHGRSHERGATLLVTGRTEGVLDDDVRRDMTWVKTLARRGGVELDHQSSGAV